MKLKDFKEEIARYHTDYDDCEVGVLLGNDWRPCQYSLPFSEGKDPTVRILLMYAGDKEKVNER